VNVIVIIHFSEQVKFSKIQIFAPVDIHHYRKWFQSNSVACSRNGSGNEFTNSGNGRTAMAIGLWHNGSVMLETKREWTLDRRCSVDIITLTLRGTSTVGLSAHVVSPPLVQLPSPSPHPRLPVRCMIGLTQGM